MERYDVVVVGVGGMGSAALYHLARRGKRVLGLERFDLLHEHGSSHGLTRIIRLAYFEHPDYVPLLRRAYELWRELESEAGEQLLHVTGIVEGGDPILDGVLRSCAEHDIAHEVLTGIELAERFPAFRLPAEMEVVYQADGGFVVPEQCIVAHVEGRSPTARRCAGGSVRSSGRKPRTVSASGPSAGRRGGKRWSSRPAPGLRTSRGSRPDR
jgi:sarcosine oxidase